MIIEVWDGAVGTGNGVAFYESTSTINPQITGIVIKANQGSLFDLNAIGINAQSSTGGSTNVTITGLNASGTPISGATITGLASVSALTTFNVSAITAFKGIASIRITSSNLVYAFIDNISLANVGVLPLSWLGFTAQAQEKNIVLNWATAVEEGTARFSIQRSANGRDWETIGNVAAAGTAAIATYYSFTDRMPLNAANYYRLTQKDLNGNQAYSKVVFIDLQNQALDFAVYPTLLSNGRLNVRINKSLPAQVFNAAGKLVLTAVLQPGTQQIVLGNLPSGLYRIKAAGSTLSFIIQ
ncbi:MAG: hypothetical protein EOO06_06725 [Chitinophagaceae bacterium]|nr:MAG: hypothetical protein EOO06_06725 [Chitinophagaceae bacterium]